MLITHFNLLSETLTRGRLLLGKVPVNIPKTLLLEHPAGLEGVWAKSRHTKQKGLLKQR